VPLLGLAMLLWYAIVLCGVFVATPIWLTVEAVKALTALRRRPGIARAPARSFASSTRRAS